MIAIPIDLDEDEFRRLNALYPPSEKSSNVGKRSVELVQYYFRKLDPSCQFRVLKKGVDLEIVQGSKIQRIEIKGTARDHLAWNQLKVSGSPSYDELRKDTPLYRVVSVYDRTPTIYVLTYSEDFDMIPEARWSVKKKKKGA